MGADFSKVNYNVIVEPDGKASKVTISLFARKTTIVQGLAGSYESAF